MRDSRTKILGYNIKAERVRKGLTQMELSEKTNIHPNTLMKIETAQQNPSALIVYDISKALNISIEELFKSVD